MTHPTNPEAIKVKRDGPRGWHWIAPENFDPALHQLADAPAPAMVAARPARGKKKEHGE